MLTIAMAVYNTSQKTKDLTERAIASIADHTDRPYALEVVDNSPPHENIGFGKAINLAYNRKPAETTYFAQMNTDCELLEDTFGELISIMEDAQLDLAFPEHYENCKLYGCEKSPELMGDDWRFGALWVAKREALDRVIAEDGFLFDPRFFAYFEDTDLWRRMEKKGMKLAGWRGTWVSHLGGQSGGSHLYFEQSKKLYEEKWGSVVHP